MPFNGGIRPDLALSASTPPPVACNGEAQIGGRGTPMVRQLATALQPPERMASRTGRTAVSSAIVRDSDPAGGGGRRGPGEQQRQPQRGQHVGTFVKGERVAVQRMPEAYRRRYFPVPPVIDRA
jgi:hypothetical protein